jgi:threonine dehydratase
MITLSDIENAADTIQSQIVRTPLVLSRSLSSCGKTPVFLKLENQQTTGSFKLRGASNAISRLGQEDRENGIVCVSTGNHGRGLAYAARQNGLKAIVCMGSLVPQNKIDGIKALGAEVRIVGDNQEDAQVEADRLVREEGMTMMPPFDHLDVIAGQGTIGLEIVQDLENIDTVIVPMSGGGLLAGVASAVKFNNPDIRVIGVSMERGCAMHLSLAAGKPVEVEEFPTLGSRNLWMKPYWSARTKLQMPFDMRILKNSKLLKAADQSGLQPCSQIKSG